MTVSTMPATDMTSHTKVSGRLHTEEATIGYDKRIISERVSVSIPNEPFTVIVGPSACAKSSLPHGLSQLLKPSEGQVMLDGSEAHSFKAKEVARQIGLLPQTSIAPAGVTTVTHLSDSLVDELPGGQRQQVRVAMALSHHTDVLLLDESTALLDITYQIELMEVFTDLHHDGHILVAVRESRR